VKTPVRTTTLLVAGLLVSLALAGLVSYYASASPDGLNRVAEDLGFHVTEKESATAGSPLADYGVAGVDNAFLSGGLAGVIGVLLVLAVGSGLAYAVRRRERASAPATERQPEEAEEGGRGR
jgi:cobalt/nickel transport protein